jgi:hypothetical protein
MQKFTMSSDDNCSGIFPPNQSAFGLGPTFRLMMEEVNLLANDRTTYFNELQPYQCQLRDWTKKLEKALNKIRQSLKKMDSRRRDSAIRSRTLRRATRKVRIMAKRAKRSLALNRRNVRALRTLIKCCKHNISQ